MVHKASSILFFSLLISFFLAPTHGKKRTEALDLLYKSKLMKNSAVDTSGFEVIRHDRVEVLPQDGLKERDRIEKLPGQPNVEFSHYGGYVTVNESTGKAFYYYFVEAQKSPTPCLFFFGLMEGLVVHLLPMEQCKSLDHSESIVMERHSTKIDFLGTMSPAGVGFSYSNTTSDLERGGDKKTASDNYVFLLNWLERYPEYKNRDFYISGESYAGHYVPQLAHTILYHNKKANKTLVDLKGIIIGNALINDGTDRVGRYDYFASHALISDKTLYQIKKYCNVGINATPQWSSDGCMAVAKEAYEDLENIDIYNIYAPLCHNTNLTQKPKKTSLLDFDPCSDYYVHAYLNIPEVQKALHANVTKLSYDWEPCSEVIKYWDDRPSTILPLLQEFMENGLRVWIFSGDTDGRIPVTSTKYSINEMKLTIKTAWHPWLLNGEVGGYTEVYKGDLTFATVRGAGHQVPSYQPSRALSLIMHFLAGTPLPNTSRHD